MIKYIVILLKTMLGSDDYRANLYALDYSKVDLTSEVIHRRVAEAIKILNEAVVDKDSAKTVEAFSSLIQELSKNDYKFDAFEKDYIEDVYPLLAKSLDIASEEISNLINTEITKKSDSENLIYIDLSKAVIQEDAQKIKNYIAHIVSNKFTPQAREHFAYMLYNAGEKGVIDLKSIIQSKDFDSFLQIVVGYFKRSNEERRIRLISGEIISKERESMRSEIEKINTKINDAVASIMNDQDEAIDAVVENFKYSDGEIRKELESQSKNNIQLLGLFTAILAFIIVNVQVFTSYTFVGALLLCVAFGLVLVSFMVGIEIVLDKVTWSLKRKSVFLLVLLSILFFLPFIAEKYYTTVPSNIFIREEINKAP